ncbi:transposase [Paraburkholderia susongensis]|uniref:Putative transposase of IS4/5 family n=1 Tax=Paraburkholderia susongensis TaxID=1515439 RepID=A0A1X7M4R0_9BURK|nr:transposase [Paraburkholderia susongensis]SMG60744.1 Putative transposase of IS4/5 family [Paraburkholderia susongensis]
MTIPSPEPVALWPVVQDLTDEQWQCVAPLLPEMLNEGPRRGRPPIDIRHVLNSVMWVLHTRAPWGAMPGHYVPYQTAHRYYLRWKKSGVLTAIMIALFKTDAILEMRATRRSGMRAG